MGPVGGSGAFGGWDQLEDRASGRGMGNQRAWLVGRAYLTGMANEGGAVERAWPAEGRTNKGEW